MAANAKKAEWALFLAEGGKYPKKKGRSTHPAPSRRRGWFCRNFGARTSGTRANDTVRIGGERLWR